MSLSSIFYSDKKIQYIDQTKLPWQLDIKELSSIQDAIRAIRTMEVRGAPLIGVSAAFGYYLGIKNGPKKQVPGTYCLRNQSPFVEAGPHADQCYHDLLHTRPTAINLAAALNRMHQRLQQPDCTVNDLLAEALSIRQDEIDRSAAIGRYGLEIIRDLYEQSKQPVNILTHCNAGWLATVEYGTATAPIYLAHDAGIPVHVWVDETRPRNQGARLTAWELSQHGVPCTLIPDNTGGHLMQNGQVDMVIVGTDRVAANGDVANKIGTYLKALAAHDNRVPFYVAMPWSSFDPDCADGKQIPIEQREADEVTLIEGIAQDPLRDPSGDIRTVRIVPENIRVANYGFDITPGRLVTAFITETGVFDTPQKMGDKFRS